MVGVGFSSFFFTTKKKKRFLDLCLSMINRFTIGNYFFYVELESLLFVVCFLFVFFSSSLLRIPSIVFVSVFCLFVVCDDFRKNKKGCPTMKKKYSSILLAFPFFFLFFFFFLHTQKPFY